MKDSELQFDRTCHVLYTKPCKKQIQAKIALHYPSERREAVWTRVQRQYVDFLSDWRTDLGGKKNFHNGRGGNYDCIALMAYYVVCRDATSLAEIEEMEGALFLPAFRKLRFVNCNRPVFKKLLYRAISTDGRRIGAITGAEIDEISFLVTALELARGLWDDLISGRDRVTDYSVSPDALEVIVIDSTKTDDKEDEFS
mgnify:CR=1 FL=1